MSSSVTLDPSVLAQAIRHPEFIASLEPDAISRLLDAAWHARLVGWLLTQLDAQPNPAEQPGWLTDRIADHRIQAEESERAVLWEVDRLERAFVGSDIPWVLLKGAAYLVAGLSPGRGRQVADLDLLVPASRLSEAEYALEQHGWNGKPIGAYDDHYYRAWMHELPPMIHRDRRSVLDLHHAILPLTSRLVPSSGRLLSRAIVVNNVRVLCPAHMLLHASVHLFHDGEIAGAVRDLVDIDGLLRHFGRDAAFWADLLSETTALGLNRPAYYAIRYAHRLVGTPVPDHVIASIAAWAPPIPALRLMDRLVARAILRPSGMRSSISAFALYTRSHWLRMPAPMLIRHLARKAWASRGPSHGSI